MIGFVLEQYVNNDRVFSWVKYVDIAQVNPQISLHGFMQQLKGRD